MLRVGRQQVKQIPTPPQLCYYKQLIVHTKHIKQPNDIIMPPQFPQYIDLLLQLGDVLWVITEHDAFAGEFFTLSRFIRVVSLCFATGGNADLPIGSLSNN